MRIVTASKAQKNLVLLIDEIAASHVPLCIVGKKRNSVLINSEDWAVISKTLHLSDGELN